MPGTAQIQASSLFQSCKQIQGRNRSGYGNSSKCHTPFTALLGQRWARKAAECRDNGGIRGWGQRAQEERRWEQRSNQKAQTEISCFPGTFSFKAAWAGIFWTVLPDGKHWQRLFLQQFVKDDTERKIHHPSAPSPNQEILQHLLPSCWYLTAGGETLAKPSTPLAPPCTKTLAACRNERCFNFHLNIIIIPGVLMLWKLPRNEDTSLRL